MGESRINCTQASLGREAGPAAQARRQNALMRSLYRQILQCGVFPGIIPVFDIFLIYLEWYWEVVYEVVYELILIFLTS